MKWIKLKKAMHGHEAGALIQVDEAIAKAYIEAGAAEDGGKGPDQAIEAVGLEELSKALKGFTDEMGTTFKAAAENVRKAGAFPTIEPLEQQADKTKSLGDFVKNVVKAGDLQDLDGLKKAQERLSKEYGSNLKKGMEESSGTGGGLWTVPVIFREDDPGGERRGGGHPARVDQRPARGEGRRVAGARPVPGAGEGELRLLRRRDRLAQGRRTRSATGASPSP